MPDIRCGNNDVDTVGSLISREPDPSMNPIQGKEGARLGREEAISIECRIRRRRMPFATGVRPELGGSPDGRFERIGM